MIGLIKKYGKICMQILAMESAGSHAFGGERAGGMGEIQQKHCEGVSGRWCLW